MEKVNRKSINDKLKKYTYSSNEEDFIEVTEWSNGEGIDVVMSFANNADKMLSISYDELEAINYLSKSLIYHD